MGPVGTFPAREVWGDIVPHRMMLSRGEERLKGKALLLVAAGFLVAGGCGSAVTPKLTDDSSTTVFCQTAKLGSVLYYSVWVFTSPPGAPIRVVRVDLPMRPSHPVQLLDFVVQTKIQGQVGGEPFPASSEASRLGIKQVGSATVAPDKMVAVGVKIRFAHLGRSGTERMVVHYLRDGKEYEQSLHLPFVLYVSPSDSVRECTVADSR